MGSRAAARCRSRRGRQSGSAAAHRAAARRPCVQPNRPGSRRPQGCACRQLQRCLQRTGRELAPPAPTPIHQRAVAVRALPPALTRQTAPFQSSETSTDPSFISITSTGRPTKLLLSRKPVRNGSIAPALPSFLMFTSTTSPPSLVVLFQEPWRATRIWFLYFAGNELPV